MVCLLAIMMATGGVQVRVGLVVRYQPQGWSIELMRFRGPHMVIYKVFTGGNWTVLIGT